MEHYVGLDVSLKQTAICVVDQAGRIVCEEVVVSDPEAIETFVKSKAPCALRVGLETSATTTWLWRELKRKGLPIICIDARHAKAALKMQINKTDRNDAIGITRIMQCGWFKEVHVKRLESHAIKALLASRAFRATIDDPVRFKRSQSVGVFIGLTAKRHASGEIDWTGRISKCGDAMLRSYLFEAAGVLLTRVPKWSALKAWGMKLAKRNGLIEAEVTVARNLAVILHRMWVDGTEFIWSTKETVA